MSQIPELYQAIMQQLTAKGLKTATKMLPGLDEAVIQRLTARLPFALPRSVIELYKCSAGQGPDCDSFFPDSSMLPLTEMLETYRELSNESEYPRFRSGGMQWFPIFDDGCCDYYGICCSQGNAADAPIIYDDNIGNHRDCVTPPHVYFNNLESMLLTILRCLETDVFFVDEKGYLDSFSVCTYNEKGQLIDVDNSRYMAVVHDCNPGLKPWY